MTNRPLLACAGSAGAADFVGLLFAAHALPQRPCLFSIHDDIFTRLPWRGRHTMERRGTIPTLASQALAPRILHPADRLRDIIVSRDEFVRTFRIMYRHSAFMLRDTPYAKQIRQRGEMLVYLLNDALSPRTTLAQALEALIKSCFSLLAPGRIVCINFETLIAAPTAQALIAQIQNIHCLIPQQVKERAGVLVGTKDLLNLQLLVTADLVHIPWYLPADLSRSELGKNAQIYLPWARLYEFIFPWTTQDPKRLQTWIKERAPSGYSLIDWAHVPIIRRLIQVYFSLPLRSQDIYLMQLALIFLRSLEQNAICRKRRFRHAVLRIKTRQFNELGSTSSRSWIKNILEDILCFFRKRDRLARYFYQGVPYRFRPQEKKKLTRMMCALSTVAARLTEEPTIKKELARSGWHDASTGRYTDGTELIEFLKRRSTHSAALPPILAGYLTRGIRSEFYVRILGGRERLGRIYGKYHFAEQRRMWLIQRCRQHLKLQLNEQEVNALMRVVDIDLALSYRVRHFLQTFSHLRWHIEQALERFLRAMEQAFAGPLRTNLVTLALLFDSVPLGEKIKAILNARGPRPIRYYSFETCALMSEGLP